MKVKKDFSFSNKELEDMSVDSIFAYMQYIEYESDPNEFMKKYGKINWEGNEMYHLKNGVFID